jgi:probable DNA metabolism protein
MMLRQVTLRPGADLDGFRRALRGLVAAFVPPAGVVWCMEGEGGLFPDEPLPEGPPLTLPRPMAELIETAVCHRDPERFALLHALVWRFLKGERHILDAAADPLVHRLGLLAHAIRRDIHKMHAFVRFRRVDTEAGERYVAWFEPDNFILMAAAPFFAARFPSQVWSIVTPDGALHWDGSRLLEGPGGRREDVPADDAFEEGWRRYYASTFNPARVNPVAMRREMPTRYWANMPEATAIPGLIRSAPSRVADMIEREAAMAEKRNPGKAVAAMASQEPKTLQELNAIIAASEPMVSGGTRAVLGEGPIGARLAFVGEQPGDQEDIEGHPFVGPAGQLLDRALAEAGIDRRAAYLTNAVKHFKFEPRGKRRIHQKPTAGEVRRYRWWLMKELELARPGLVVALGGTAALALSGKALSVTANRGPTTFEGRPGFVTVHPSYLLRIPDDAAKADAYAAFLADLRRAATLAKVA